MKQNDKSPHILNASSNLLGICFIVLTSLKLLKKTEETVLDEIAIAAVALFMASCILSFLSIRSKAAKSELLENIADIIFLGGLTVLFVTTILFSLDVIE
jgi:tellurite resistance protein TehA-like permease